MKLALTALVALAAVVSLAPQANADSRAICQEREKLATDFQAETHARFVVGELTRTNVAESDLGVLDVQLACHLIRASTYVNEATTAANIALKGNIAELRDGFRTQAQVDLAQKKVQTVANIAKSQTQCNSTFADLQTVIDKTNEDFKRGNASRIEVSDAALNLLDARLKCAAMLIGTYCSEAPALAKTFAEGVTSEARVGQRTSLDVMAAQQREVSVRSTCL